MRKIFLGVFCDIFERRVMWHLYKIYKSELRFCCCKFCIKSQGRFWGTFLVEEMLK